MSDLAPLPVTRHGRDRHHKGGEYEVVSLTSHISHRTVATKVAAATRAPWAYRAAIPDDAVECVALRGMTRENAVSEARLRAVGITAENWSNDIGSGALPGHVCSAGGKIVGYCFGSSQDGEIVVLALLPAFEGQGIGRELLSRVVRDLAAMGKTRLFLGCSRDPVSRSYGFYRHLGWRSTEQFDRHGDEILELHV